jgi:hypothetical protein
MIGIKGIGKRVTVSVAMLLAGPGTPAGPGDSRTPHGPQLGDVQKLKVITVSLQVGCTEKESKKVTYSPPPGWYVRSHVVECAARTGNSSFTVNTVPQNWSWFSEDKIHESYKLLLDMAAKAHDEEMLSKLRHERDETLQELRRCQASHHALVVDATARGGGILRGSGSLDLTVTAELVYVGTQAELTKKLDRHKALLKSKLNPHRGSDF